MLVTIGCPFRAPKSFAVVANAYLEGGGTTWRFCGDVSNYGKIGCAPKGLFQEEMPHMTNPFVPLAIRASGYKSSK